MSCGVGCRPVATAPIRLLAWEPPYDMGVALKKDKKTKKRKEISKLTVIIIII